ncbi:hypothetical protein BRARA_E01330 [Brassica rapa]|uniref:RING-CH-type domain-containing protein n=1 Tax=Brassica campestris TaxID=3711 RepID=A0A397ZD63_BRACM|nr:hypothetical protein BRARA_E01330 [Brassica rapa]
MDQIPCSNSITVCESSSGSVPEAVIVVSGLKGETSDSLSQTIDASEKAKEKEFHMIDLSGGGEESDNGQRICRICHFGSDQTPDRVSGKFVSLGLAHFHCAEAWFKLRGNSVCEICGSSALNVPVRLTEEECSEIKDTTTGEGRRRGSGQSCCIFMVFLLTIILLHWFFKKMSGYYQNT